MRKKLIVTLIIISLILVMILDFKTNGIRIFENFIWEFETESLRDLFEGKANYSYNGPLAEEEFTDQVIYISDGIKELYINNEMGSIEIRGEDREDILLSYKLTVYAESEKLAESFLKELSIVEHASGKRLSLKLGKPELPKGVYAVRVAYNLSIPEDLFLNISNRYGELKVEKMTGDIVVKNSYHLCQIADIGGQAEISANYGTLIVRNIKDNADIESSYNTLVDISNIGGDLVLETRYSKTRIADIAGKLELNSEFGSVDFARVRGNLDLRTYYTDLEGSEVEGKIAGKINYGNLDLFQLMNEIDLDCSYTDLEIYLKDSMDKYQIYCETEYGDIKTNLTYKIEKDKNRQSLTGGDGEKLIYLVNKYGDIRFYK